MPYKKLNIKNGQILNETHLAHFEQGISENNTNIEEIQDKIKNIEDNGGNTSIVYPEQFGAVGDGVNDDGKALQQALESGKPVYLTQDLYIKSRVRVINRDVVFDGRGYTLHCDGAALDFKDSADFIVFFPNSVDPDKADVKIYHEVPPHYKRYHRGWIEYKGRKPIPVDEVYDDYTVVGFMEHRVIVRNVTLSCKNFKGLCALTLRKMCHSLVDNVRAIMEDYTGTGSVGILVDMNCFTTVRNCYGYGFTDDLSCNVTNRGYGVCVNGNSIIVDGCECWNNKHGICIAGNRDFWSTDIHVTNCTFGVIYNEDKRIDGSNRFQQVMDSHAGGLGLRFDNNTIIIRNAGTRGSPHAFLLSAPYVHCSGLEVLCDGAGCWATVSGLADKVYLDNVHGENLSLQPGSLYEGSTEFHLNNCLFKRLQNSYDIYQRIYMTNCTVTQLVDYIQWLKADNCYFGHDIVWGSHACIRLLGEGIFNGCTIYGHNEGTISPTRSIIEAPEDSIRMQGCYIYIRNGKYKVFNTNQPNAEYWTENIFGFRLGTKNGVLDTNELY